MSDRPGMRRISPAATRSEHRRVLSLDLDLVRTKAKHARRSDRQRDIHVLHDGDEDTLQRMLNALQPGSYVAPHRHLSTPKAEALVLLQGSLAFVAFREDGTVDERLCAHLAPSTEILALDCRPGVWHTIFALEPDTVVFEVKPGPYDAGADKEFADWAPPEGAPGDKRYLADLEDAFRQRHGLPPREWEPAVG
ncbi:MAG: WbuC family cupin fold metalloprotein [Planctomycetota bacterium]|jgi:cupin fold WbuC family metalloprotein